MSNPPVAGSRNSSDPTPATPSNEAQQAVTLIIGKVASSLAEALAPLVLVRILSPTQVGQVAAALLVYTTTATVLTAGFPNAILYFVAGRDIQTRRGVAQTMTRVLLSMAALAAVGFLSFSQVPTTRLDLGWLSVPQDLAMIMPALALLAIYALADFPSRLLPNILLAEGRAGRAAAMGVVQSLLTVAGTLLPAIWGFGVYGVIAGLAAASCIYSGIFFAHLYFLYRHAPAKHSVRAGEMFRYCLPLGATMITNTLNSSIDQWLIAGSFGARELAIYRSGAYQIPLITTIAYSVGAVYLPRFTELFRSGKALEAISIWRASIHKTSILVVPLALIFIVGAEEFIELAFTEEYIRGADVFRAYCFLVLGRVAAFGHVILAAGRPSYVLWSSLATLASNIVISIPLLYYFGFLGPAWGTAINFIPTLFYYNYGIARATGIRLHETFPLLAYLRVVLLSLPGVLLATWLKYQWTLAPGVSLVVTTVTILACWAIVGSVTRTISASDWAFLRSRISGRRRK